MHRSTIAALALAGALGVTGSGPALADGMPYRGGPACCAFSWTGFYVGLNAGYAWSDNSASLAPSPDAFSQAFWNPAFNAGAVPRKFQVDQDGLIGGAQLGYNVQAGAFVIGVEVDWQGGDVDGGQSIATNVPPFVPGIVSSNQRLDWFGTVRGRLGYAADRVLLYVTGGLAYGEVKYGLNFAFPNANDFHTIAASQRESGWTVGGGVEIAFAHSWTLKGEYLYVDLGDTTLVSTPSGRAANLASTLTERFDNQYHIARIGLNYKFGAREVVPLK